MEWNGPHGNLRVIVGDDEIVMEAFVRWPDGWAVRAVAVLRDIGNAIPDVDLEHEDLVVKDKTLKRIFETSQRLRSYSSR
jgi:hypothetical protein